MKVRRRLSAGRVLKVEDLHNVGIPHYTVVDDDWRMKETSNPVAAGDRGPNIREASQQVQMVQNGFAKAFRIGWKVRPRVFYDSGKIV